MMPDDNSTNNKYTIVNVTYPALQLNEDMFLPAEIYTGFNSRFISYSHCSYLCAIAQNQLQANAKMGGANVPGVSTLTMLKNLFSGLSSSNGPRTLLTYALTHVIHYHFNYSVISCINFLWSLILFFVQCFPLLLVYAYQFLSVSYSQFQTHIDGSVAAEGPTFQQVGSEPHPPPTPPYSL